MRIWRLAFAVLAGWLAPEVAGATGPSIAVAAADSTCAVVNDAGELFFSRHHIRVNSICKSSGRLAKGIIGGAISADFFISANKEWMDEIVGTGHVAPEAVRSLWANILVVAAPRASSLSVAVLGDLAAPAVRQLLIGDPGTAPFGRYTKQSLEKAGIWDKVLPRVATRKNISLLVEGLVEADDATAGILFATHLNDRLRVLATIPEGMHDPVRYFSAPLRASGKKEPVAAFAAFIESGEAKEIFRKHGFRVVP